MRTLGTCCTRNFEDNFDRYEWLKKELMRKYIKEGLDNVTAYCEAEQTALEEIFKN